jgi:hypothetical protein
MIKLCLPARQCAVDGCDRPVYNHNRAGLCSAHHHRLRRWGDPLGGAIKHEVTHPLAEKLHQLSVDTGLPLSDLTVLSPRLDPYRLDTPGYHRDGAWFKERMDACGIDRLHLRGIHYAIFSIGSVKPDGRPYLNDNDAWEWLETRASKASRWLGYVPFDAIEDARNSEPVTRLRAGCGSSLIPYASVSGFDPTALEVIKNGIDISLSPALLAEFNVPPQPYQLVFWGEKSSIDPVLGPLAKHYNADLYLTIGEPSDTVLHTMAKTGAEDGREMVVFTFSDCDPSGYQMPVSIAHKLRAFSDSLFPDLRFRVVTACLTVEQVHKLGLPSTPLKATEKRAWREKYGIDQTEIDALVTLRPDVFREIVHDAVRPYYDATLAKRVSMARWAWYDKARPIWDAALAEIGFEAAQAEAEEEISDLASDLIEVVNERVEGLRAMVHELLPDYFGRAYGKKGTLSEKLPPMGEIPQPQLDEPPTPFVSSAMLLADSIKILKDRKDYT